MSGDGIRFSYGAAGPDASEAVRSAVVTERLGFDNVWVADHLTDIPPFPAVMDAWSVLSYIGALTSRIRLGPGVTDIQKIHPAKTANIVATLDKLTHGRVVLGIGAGEAMNIKPYGMNWEPPDVRIKRLRESIQVMKLLWSSSYEHPVDFEGEFYSLAEASLPLPPVQKPHPPIYVGAFTSSKMLSLIGEMADGWYPSKPNTPESFKGLIDIIGESARRAGRSLRDIDAVTYVPVAVGDKRFVMEEAKEKLKWTLIFHRSLLKLLGAEDAIGKLPKDLEYQYIKPSLDYGETLQRAVEALPVPDEVLEKGVEKMMAVGLVDECIESIEKFVKAGATHIDPRPLFASKENYDAISKKIIPYFTPTQGSR